MLQFGDNGLLKKSKEAVDKSKLAQTEELIKMDLLAAYIDAELAGEDKPTNETIKEIVEKHGGTIDESNPNVIQTPNGEIKLDEILNDTSSDTKDPDEINSTIESLNKRIAELNKQLQTERNEKNELQSQVNNLNEQVTDLNTQVADWKKKAEDGEVTIAEKDTQISNLNSQITSKNKEIEQKTTRIQELEGNVTTLINEKNTLQTQVVNLNTRIAELEGKQATGDAIASDVLAGKTFSTASGVNLTGTMVNRGTLNFNPSIETTITVEPGYYEGGTISSADAYANGAREELKNLPLKSVSISPQVLTVNSAPKWILPSDFSSLCFATCDVIFESERYVRTYLPGGYIILAYKLTSETKGLQVQSFSEDTWYANATLDATVVGPSGPLVLVYYPSGE